MSPSTLRGRPSVTVHLYDDQGRLTRTVTESPWTDEDRALLLAYQLWERSLCDCGEPKSRAHHPDNDGHYDTGEAVVCHACTAMRKAHQSGSKEPVKPVELFRLIHDRDYVKDPLPDLPSDGEVPDLWA